MINPKIFNAVLMAATKETKDLVLKALVEHISKNYDYHDEKAAHVVDILLDKNAFVTPEKVNLKWIEAHPEYLIYQSDKYNIRNIAIDSIDNIDCIACIKFEYLEKINEDRDDVSYNSSNSDISFVDCPQLLK